MRTQAQRASAHRLTATQPGSQEPDPVCDPKANALNLCHRSASSSPEEAQAGFTGGPALALRMPAGQERAPASQI